MKRQGYNYVDLVGYGVKKVFHGFNIIRMFSPHAFAGNLTKGDLKEAEDGGLKDTTQLLRKFYKKYPEIKYMPVSGPIEMQKGGQIEITHPASIFIKKQ